MPQKNYHVVKGNDGKWKVKRAGSQRATSSHEKKRLAVEAGRQAAKKTNGELSIHNRNGRIARKHSYGNDPRSTKG